MPVRSRCSQPVMHLAAAARPQSTEEIEDLRQFAERCAYSTAMFCGADHVVP